MGYVLPHTSEGVGSVVAADLASRWDEMVGPISLVAGRRAGSQAIRFGSGAYLGGLDALDNWGGTPRWTHGCAVRITGLLPGEHATLAQWYQKVYTANPSDPYDRSGYGFLSARALRVYGDGHLAVHAGGADVATSPPGALPLGQWAYLDESFTLQSHWYQYGWESAWVNGAAVLDAASIANTDTPPASYPTDQVPNYCRWGNLELSNGATVDVMDATWQRGTFTAQTPIAVTEAPPPPLGDVVVVPLRPSGPGTTPATDAMWGLVGATENWQANVDAAGIDGDATHVQAPWTVNLTDHYAFEPIPAGAGTVASIPFVTHRFWSRWRNPPTPFVVADFPAWINHHWHSTTDAGAATTYVNGGQSLNFSGTSYRAWFVAEAKQPSASGQTPTVFDATAQPWTPARLARTYFGFQNATIHNTEWVHITASEVEAVLKLAAPAPTRRLRSWAWVGG